MKRLLLLLVCILGVFSVYSQESTDVDTVYFDKDWKGVSSPKFASYYRVIEKNSDLKAPKHYRDYFLTGELQSEGLCLTMDKNDDRNSVFDGEFTIYYKNGKVKEKGNRIRGISDGEYTVYYENGLIATHADFKKGKLNGILTQFSEDGSLCKQIEYVDDKPAHDYYILSNAQGYACKYRIRDDKMISESPDPSEMKSEYKNGTPWQYYVKNGLMLALSNSQVKDYGKYFRITIVIANNSLSPIDFYPSNIKSHARDKKGKYIGLTVYSVEDYMKKVNRKQNWAAALNGLAEGLAASNAGYSSSTTNSSTYSSGTANVSGNAMAAGSGGWAVGSYSGTGSYSGSSYTSSTTTSYDGAAAYQAQVISSNRIAAYENALMNDRMVKEEGYLKQTTINPGEVISGYIHIERKKGETMNISVEINGATYKFPWSIAK
ncbi:hypothetical protein [uncultured Parabacteroides sp.]|uniref:toxin-antitoxin system YwqK family antitoxin n=1 Tax=uncultured Parabacteroides sp. TaxID=512312 RepID=UPI0025DDBED0|nr:hypothetical protein [uncultured Parabacteroides sp.]